MANPTKTRTHSMPSNAIGKLAIRPAREGEFDTDLEALTAQLASDGVAVLPGVLTVADCHAMQDGFWDAIEQMTSKFDGVRTYKSRADEPIAPIQRNDRSTWRNVQELQPMHGMLLQHWGIGGAREFYRVRTLPSVYRAFEVIHGVPGSQLLSSSDGVSLWLPYQKEAKYVREGKPWFHTDHAFADSGERHSVQSWVTAYDVGPRDATLGVIKGSHKFHAEFARRFGLDALKEDWYKLQTQEEVDFFVDRGCELVRVTCPAGAQVLWDSRLMHCGLGPVGGTQDALRMVIYCSYAPRSRASARNLKRKREGFELQKTTTHRGELAKRFADQPRTYGKTMQPVQKPRGMEVTEFSSVGKRLFALE